MKLAFIHQPIGDAIDPGRHSGSLTIFLYEIARRLAASCEVIIYTRRLPSQLEIEQVDGIQYRRLVPFYDDRLLRRVNWFADFRSRNRPMFASHWFHHGYIRRIAKDLPGQHCDFAFVQTLPQYPAVIRNFNPELRIALNMQSEWLNQLDRSMISRHLQAVDLVLGCSKYITEKVQAAFPEYSGRCRTLLNGCDIDRFSGRSGNEFGARRLLFVARVSPEKGVHVLLNAFCRLAEHYPELQLDIVGPVAVPDRTFVLDVSDDPKVRALSRYYSTDYLAALKGALPANLAERVNFRGAISHQQLASCYAGAYAFVFPAVWDEPFGLPVIEAMASGLPVIASGTGGIPELVVHGKTGFLCPPNDAPALASAIGHLLDNPDIRQRMSESSRQRAMSLFSWERVVDDLLGYLHEFAPHATHVSAPVCGPSRCNRFVAHSIGFQTRLHGLSFRRPRRRHASA